MYMELMTRIISIGSGISLFHIMYCSIAGDHLFKIIKNDFEVYTFILIYVVDDV